jgi:Rhodopirellula transposase DDE domain
VDQKEGFRERLLTLMPHLNERQLRIAAALEARSLGYGGVSAVAEVSGIARGTIHRGLEELKDPKMKSALDQVRVGGGGRKKIASQNPRILKRLKAMVESNTRGDPMSPLLWTCRSTRELAGALSQQGDPISADTVGRLLAEIGYSLQANMKTLEGAAHPDRDQQFKHLNRQVGSFLKRENPVISVDTKKKELIGPYYNKGRRWLPKGEPEEVKVHDFLDPGESKAIPYGIYDVAKNQGWVNVGCDHDTASFAVASIRRWWSSMGSSTYPEADQLLICADSGGSNGYRIRLWKLELQSLVDETGLWVTVCHLPPGTSKWNKIEHRLFSHISMNWRGRPLVSHEVVVKLIGATMTKNGLKVRARLDKRKYPLKIKVSDEDMKSLNLEPHEFHGEWNYTIKPRKLKSHDY